jgi:DNA-directed RNA polymerase subunit H (RpoH/RPB5)
MVDWARAPLQMVQKDRTMAEVLDRLEARSLELPAIDYTDAVQMAFERVHTCPVSGETCRHYRDCERVGYCWLK